ncbi:unnamed protein product, partial [Prorocentrum cordatum]
MHAPKRSQSDAFSPGMPMDAALFAGGNCDAHASYGSEWREMPRSQWATRDWHQLASVVDCHVVKEHRVLDVAPAITCYTGLHLLLPVFAVVGGVAYFAMPLPLTGAEGNVHDVEPSTLCHPSAWLQGRKRRVQCTNFGPLQPNPEHMKWTAYADLFSWVALVIIATQTTYTSASCFNEGGEEKMYWEVLGSSPAGGQAAKRYRTQVRSPSVVAALILTSGGSGFRRARLAEPAPPTTYAAPATTYAQAAPPGMQYVTEPVATQQAPVYGAPVTSLAGGASMQAAPVYMTAPAPAMTTTEPAQYAAPVEYAYFPYT